MNKSHQLQKKRSLYLRQRGYQFAQLLTQKRNVRGRCKHCENELNKQNQGQKQQQQNNVNQEDVGYAQGLYQQSESDQIKVSWDLLMRWSKSFKYDEENEFESVKNAKKITIFGAGSFGTAMACIQSQSNPQLDVVLLGRSHAQCADINTQHKNPKYFKDFELPHKIRATTDATIAIQDTDYIIHAVPVQRSRAYLENIKHLIKPTTPIISVSKGLELGTGAMMSDVIQEVLGPDQRNAFISGPSFAHEVIQARPTGVVVAANDATLAREIQHLLRNPSLRINTTTDVIGVEICGALKNVLAIAAGIVEGLGLGHNAQAALIAHGCSEIRWLAERMGAKSTTVAGLAGLGDIMLTCYGSLSRNRSVGVRLGQGERVEDIVASSNQVAEGVATAGVVVSLARKYRVSLPVLTAVAQILDGRITPVQAVQTIMNLPQIEEH